LNRTVELYPVERFVPVVNTIADLLRLLAVPAFAWVAWRDLTTRRVADRVWVALGVLAVVALAWELLSVGGFDRRFVLVRAAVSVGVVVPLSYVFWRLGGFGGADAKAFMTISVLFPTYPAYGLIGITIPQVETAIGVFSLTIVTNTVLVGICYPLALAISNARAGEFALRGFVAKRVSTASVTERYGRLFGVGSSGSGLDLDALRMYLRWRGLSLADLRDDRPAYRDPRSLPTDPNPPGDGAIGAPTADGGGRSSDVAVGAVAGAGGTTTESDTAREASAREYDDPWGAATFLSTIDSGAYGTTPDELRAGLDRLTSAETVWITPGIPFLLPLFVGLCVAFTYGDLLFTALRALGVF
jgi:archaeal preflagellin peptidase FlaK